MSRIGGVFPFPFQSAATGDGAYSLASGCTYLVPAGDWLWETGPQIQLQWFDPQQLAWRVVGQTGQGTTFLSSDGTNFRFVNLSGVVVGAAITAAGSGATNGIGSAATGVNVTFTAPGAGGALATATAYPVVGGSVQAPLIVQGGSLFEAVPLIMIDPPPVGGVQATATATISAAGVVTAITMTNVGAGYTSSPNFYVIPQPAVYQGGPIAGVAANAFPSPGLVYPTNLPGGQFAMFEPNKSLNGCQLTPQALTGTGTLTAIGIMDYGAGYTGTTIPTVTITGAGGAAATAIMSMCVTSVTLSGAGAGYGAGAGPLWRTSNGLVAAAWNNNAASIRPASGTTTVSGGGVATFVIEDAGFGLQRVPTVAVINSSALSTGQATGTAVCGGVVDTFFLQGRVQ